MAIKSIVVHPKGATHKDNLGYFLKQEGDSWFYWDAQWRPEVLTLVRLQPLR